MEPRANWHALQARLDAARELFAAGDRLKALEAIEAALEIDPNFLGAQLLREQMLRGQPKRPPAAPPPPAMRASGEEFAQFEQRARRRRTERRLEAARAAIAARREREARQAIEELGDLDPDLPGLRELTLQANDLRRSNVRPRVARWLVAATACFAVTFATLSIERSRSASRRASPADDRAASLSLPAAPNVVPAPRVPTAAPDESASAAPTPAESASPEPAPTERANPASAPTESVVPTVAASGTAPVPSSVATGGSRVKAQAHEAAPSPVPGQPERRGVAQATTEALNAPGPREAARPSPIERTPSTVPPVATLPSEPVAPSSAPSSRVPTVAPTTPTVAPTTPTVAPPTPSLSTRPSAVPAAASVSGDDTALVQTVLQRYRTAYEGLDARSAAAVWPAVNQTALARAFDGLASQALIFDVCYVKLEGNAADAICRGSARYVPKVGSREPRIESRVWTFALRKAGSDWRIENARADR